MAEETKDMETLFNLLTDHSELLATFRDNTELQKFLAQDENTAIYDHISEGNVNILELLIKHYNKEMFDLLSKTEDSLINVFLERPDILELLLQHRNTEILQTIIDLDQEIQDALVNDPDILYNLIVYNTSILFKYIDNNSKHNNMLFALLEINNELLSSIDPHVIYKFYDENDENANRVRAIFEPSDTKTQLALLDRLIQDLKSNFESEPKLEPEPKLESEPEPDYTTQVFSKETTTANFSFIQAIQAPCSIILLNTNPNVDYFPIMVNIRKLDNITMLAIIKKLCEHIKSSIRLQEITFIVEGYNLYLLAFDVVKS